MLAVICANTRDFGTYHTCAIRLAPVSKTIFHQCVISYTCSQSNSDDSVKTEPSELDWLQVTEPSELDWLQVTEPSELDWLQVTEPSELDWLQVIWYDTLMKNCFKDWSQSNVQYTPLIHLLTRSCSAVSNVSGYRCESDCRSRGLDFDPARSHTFVEIVHETIFGMF